MGTTPMFSPDGTLGDIPNERVADAQRSGFRLGQDMLAPDGTPGIIPIDKLADASKAGFKPRGFVSAQTESPIAPPAIQKPAAPLMSEVYLNTGNPVPPTPSIKDMANAAAKNLYQISTPGIITSLMNKRFPNAPIPNAMKRDATPAEQLPGQIISNMGPVIAGGMAEPTPEPVQPSARPNPVVQPQPAAPAGGPTLGSIMARHIPVVGKVLRTIDDIQALMGKDTPANPTNMAGAKVPVPETNGIQWGTGGQGPLNFRGKMIPQQPISGTNNPATWPAPTPAAAPTDPAAIAADRYQVVDLGGIKQAKPNLPEMTPAPSTTISAHGYNPARQEMFITFKNGNTYRYSGVPQEVYDNYANAESHGSFHAQNIKGKYQTDLVSKGGGTPGSKVSQALATTPTGRPLTAQELAVQAQPGTTGVAPDIGNWQPPPELGAFNAKDYGASARAAVQEKMGPLPRNK